MPIGSALNSASATLTYFFKGVDMVPRKAARLEKLGLKFFANLESAGTNFFYRKLTRICVSEIRYVKF